MSGALSTVLLNDPDRTPIPQRVWNETNTEDGPVQPINRLQDTTGAVINPATQELQTTGNGFLAQIHNDITGSLHTDITTTLCNTINTLNLALTTLLNTVISDVSANHSDLAQLHSDIVTTLAALIGATNTALAGTLATKEKRSTTGAQTSVASATGDGTILASNPNRLGGTIFNDSTQVLYLLLASGTSSNSNYSLQVKAGGYYEIPSLYTGVIKGCWAAANGNARVTELT